MDHFIIGTAGHIDHGKTALIGALTGRDTDTLKEEKERKISIDLGFTYFDLPDGSRAGVIDVPGHEKFLPNMLAGVCGMDLVLLVIALDEGIMPQTREHMDILELLHIPDGIVVLTKEDCVEPEWAELMEEEIREELRGTMFADWGFQRVSAVRGTGIEELKALIARRAEKICRRQAGDSDQKEGGSSRRRETGISESRNRTGAFRMPVDRVMSVKGFGTVIAGTVLEGRVSSGEVLMLYPSEEKVKIKNVQVHGEDVETACAGQRAALLLSGVEKEKIKRGFTAAFPDSLRLTRFLDVKLQMVKDTNRVLKNRNRLHLHIGASQGLCRAVLLDREKLRAGESGYAQLVLEEPLAVKKKDRFILRFYSPLETIGGGVVLEEHPRKHKRFEEETLALLKEKEENRDGAVLLSCLSEHGKKPVEKKELAGYLGFEESRLTMLLEELRKDKACLVLPGKKQDFYWISEMEKEQRRRLEAALGEYHKQHPFRTGMERALLKNGGWKDWENDRFEAWLAYLEEERCVWNMAVQPGGGEVLQPDRVRVCLYGFAPAENEQSRRLCEHLTQALSKAGYDFRNSKDLRPKEMDEETYEEILEFFVRRDVIVRINEDFCTTPELARGLKEMVRAYFSTHDTITYAVLRDLMGSTKRSARPAMAYLDRQEITAPSGKETERLRGAAAQMRNGIAFEKNGEIDPIS